MKLLKKYLLLNFSQTFFPIFLTLFTITSIIFLVKIASLTSIIQINFIELLELYSYSVPTILFYTLPISIFISSALTLNKLSSEYELIVITSFGLTPIKILKLLFPTIFLSTISLLFISLALIPKAEYMKVSFMETKQSEAQFNIKASEYGQEFGKWLIYVNKEDKGLYNDVVLFQQNKDKDTFIISEYATIENDGFSLSLNLLHGKAINITENLNQIDFQKMIINNTLKPNIFINTLSDLISYWKLMSTNKTVATNFVFSILISIFPLISILFAIYLGYYNPRYEKNRATVFGIILTTLFLTLSHRISEEFTLVGLAILPGIWIILSIFLYRLKIKPHY